MAVKQEKDVIVFWDHGAVTPEMIASFTRPTALLSLGGGSESSTFQQQVGAMNWPYPLRNVIQTRLPDVRPLRVALVGFSASCAGVAQFLRSADAGYVDSVVCIDGIHAKTGSYGIVRGAELGPYVSHGKMAAFGIPPTSNYPQGSKLLVVTNSHANGPPGYDPTWLTSKEILDKIVAGVPFTSDELPSVVFEDPSRHPWTNPGGTIAWSDGSSTTFKTAVYDRPPIEYAIRIGEMSVLSYRLVDPTSIGDHRYQAAVVRKMAVASLLGERWNRLPPSSGTCMVVA
jgi:hypothetical protein